MKGIDLYLTQYFQNNDLLPKYEKLMKFLETDYTQIKEYLCQQSFYTNISVAYFQLLFAGKTDAGFRALKQILVDSHAGAIPLANRPLKSLFCGYLRYLVQMWANSAEADL